MNPKLLPLLQRIVSIDDILSSFDAASLPQSALAYVRQNYGMDDKLTPEDQDLIETLPPFADIIRASFSEGSGGNASIYHVFDDGSLWIKTNAYQEVWADARDFVVERILPRMELSRLDAGLMREIGMDDQIAEVRDDFFAAFAQVLNRECGIPYQDAREHWNAWSRQAPHSLIEDAELGGGNSGRSEGMLFASVYAVPA